MLVVILMSSFNSKTNKEIKTDIMIWNAIITASFNFFNISVATQHLEYIHEQAL